MEQELKTSRIYILRSFKTDKIYIGSTINKLKERLIGHKSDYKRWKDGKSRFVSSFEIIKYDDCYIELIKEIVCTKQQLLILEGEEINKYDNCININIAGALINDEQYKCKYNKTYKEQHKEYTKDYNHNYKRSEEYHTEEKKAARKEANRKYYLKKKENNIFNKCIDGRITESER